MDEGPAPGVVVGVEPTGGNADQLLQPLPILVGLLSDDRARPPDLVQADHLVDDCEATLLDVADRHLLLDRIPITGPVVLSEGLVDPLGVVELRRDQMGEVVVGLVEHHVDGELGTRSSSRSAPWTWGTARRRTTSFLRDQPNEA